MYYLHTKKMRCLGDHAGREMQPRRERDVGWGREREAVLSVLDFSTLELFVFFNVPCVWGVSKPKLV